VVWLWQAEQRRIDADKYYRGEPLGNELEGRSQVVSRDVAEAVDGAMPSVMRVFAGGEQVVAFDPHGPEDEDAADQATDYINHIFMSENEGFMILYTWFKDAFLKKNGIVKCWHDVRYKRTKDDYDGLTQTELATLQSNPDVQVTNIQQYADTIVMQDPQSGMPVPQQVPCFSCTVISVKPEKRIKIENVAPDEFIIERRATSIYTAGFLAHRGKRTISDLLECGYDADKVMASRAGMTTITRRSALSASAMKTNCPMALTMKPTRPCARYGLRKHTLNAIMMAMA
jgi:hypothetical protein